VESAPLLTVPVHRANRSGRRFVVGNEADLSGSPSLLEASRVGQRAARHHIAARRFRLDSTIDLLTRRVLLSLAGRTGTGGDAPTLLYVSDLFGGTAWKRFKARRYHTCKAARPGTIEIMNATTRRDHQEVSWKFRRVSHVAGG
jgi:hypothetical protein